MTIGEAAMALGVSEKTVRRRIKDGSLAAQLVGEPPHYEIPADAVAAMSAQRGPESAADELAVADDFQNVLWELTEALREQLKEKDRQLEEKDRQIRELHVMLQTGQENLGRLMLNPPAYQQQHPPQMHQPQQPQLQGPRRSWWKLWS